MVEKPFRCLYPVVRRVIPSPLQVAVPQQQRLTKYNFDLESCSAPYSEQLCEQNISRNSSGCGITKWCAFQGFTNYFDHRELVSARRRIQWLFIACSVFMHPMNPIMDYGSLIMPSAVCGLLVLLEVMGPEVEVSGLEHVPAACCRSKMKFAMEQPRFIGLVNFILKGMDSRVSRVVRQFFC